jgi:ParB-like chromosome segregation protein Spo0J
MPSRIWWPSCGARKLADKLGKDKGYLENRLRLADAPPEIRELVSLRKDSLSHAYELMKVENPKKRQRLAAQVARGELTLIKLRDKIEGRRTRPLPADDLETGEGRTTELKAVEPATPEEDAGWQDAERVVPISDDSLVNAKQELADAVENLVAVLRSPEARGMIPQTDRTNLAKYLTIAKLKLENAIALVRSDNPDY